MKLLSLISVSTVYDVNYFVDHFLFTEIARANGGNDIEEAVITIPLHFNDEQRAAIKYFISIIGAILSNLINYTKSCNKNSASADHGAN